jgi:hypothetical protein
MADHRANAVAVIAEIGRASGLTFARPDRMTRAEAEAAIRWAEGNTEFVAAYTDRSHPHHTQAQSHSVWPFFFAHDYLQGEDGQPVDWDSVPIADTAAPAEPEFEDVFKDWTPERERQRLGETLKDPRFAEWREA